VVIYVMQCLDLFTSRQILPFHELKITWAYVKLLTTKSNIKGCSNRDLN